VRLVRRVDRFLETPKLRLGPEAKRNIRFYLAKYAACAAIGNAHCPAVEICQMDVDAITDESLKTYLKVIKGIYRRYGSNDDAGRSPKMSAALNKVLLRTFSKRTKHEGQNG
jgi:hypothetical protein